VSPDEIPRDCSWGSLRSFLTQSASGRSADLALGFAGFSFISSRFHRLTNAHHGKKRADGSRVAAIECGPWFPRGCRSCEKMNNLTQRRQGAKTRKEQLLCFLCAFYDFAPLREMLLPIQGLFHSICRRGPPARTSSLGRFAKCPAQQSRAFSGGRVAHRPYWVRYAGLTSPLLNQEGNNSGNLVVSRKVLPTRRQYG
jgi:hypothetical protein